MSIFDELEDFAKGKTPVGGKTPGGYTVKMVGGKRTYIKEDKKPSTQLGLFDQKKKPKPKKEPKPQTWTEQEWGDTTIVIKKDSKGMQQVTFREKDGTERPGPSAKYANDADRLAKEVLREEAKKKFEEREAKEKASKPKPKKKAEKTTAAEQKYKDAKKAYNTALAYELKIVDGPLKSPRSVKAAWEASERTNEARRAMQEAEANLQKQADKKKLANVWKNTHRDYKSTTGGVKSILVNRPPDGTVLVPLTELTDSEINERLRKTEKSMSGKDVFEELLEKAGAHAGLPSGQPKLGDGPEDGGPLAGKGKTSGTNDAGGRIAAESKPPQTKLSEDDEEDEKQMKEHKKPIEKQLKRSLSPSAQRDMVAQEQAQLVSQLKKGDDIIVNSYETVQAEQPEPLEKAHYSTQGADAMVLYSNASDLACEQLLKSEAGESPTITMHGSPLYQTQKCPRCENELSKALTACPECGLGTTQQGVTYALNPMGIPNKSDDE